MQQPKFTNSSLRKALKKQTKTNEDQHKRHIKAIEDHGKRLVESIKFIKKDFNIDRDSIQFEQQQQQQQKLTNLLEKGLLNFGI